jgi:hypothetical protein
MRARNYVIVRRFSLAALFVAIAANAAACSSSAAAKKGAGGSDSSEDDGSGNGPSGPSGPSGGQTAHTATSGGAMNCSSRCAAVAMKCGAMPAQVTAACGEVCAASPTESELECLESSDCAKLGAAFMNNTPICGIGGTTTGGPTGGGTTSAGTGGGAKGLGDPCKCPTADEVLCESADGPCQPGLTCLNNHGVCASSCTNGDGMPDMTLCHAPFMCAQTEVGYFCLASNN